jgi:hypothetical protein
MAVEVVEEIDVNELDSCFFQGTLNDENGDPVEPDALTDIRLTLYNKTPDDIVNDRDDVSVKNANGGTYSDGGVFRMDFVSLDSPIVSDELGDGKVEKHYALFAATWGTGKRKSFLVQINVKQMRHVPTA